MAQFTPKPVEYIESTLKLAISLQSDQVGSFLAKSKATQDNLFSTIEKHNNELHEGPTASPSWWRTRTGRSWSSRT